MMGPGFEAIIVPHRSLTAGGLRWVTGVVIGLSVIISAGLLWLGAWPVLGFMGLEVVLAVVLLRRNARRQPVETVMLDEAGVLVRRTAPGRPATEVRVPAAWLQVVLEERQGRVPALLLASRGVREEIGASLGEVEKRDLAGALRAALDRWRRPDVDNPQLRD